MQDRWLWGSTPGCLGQRVQKDWVWSIPAKGLWLPFQWDTSPGNHLVTSLPRPLALQHAVASQSAVPLGLGPLANTFSSLLDSSSCSPFAPWSFTRPTSSAVFLGSKLLSVYTAPAPWKPCRDTCKKQLGLVLPLTLPLPSSPINRPPSCSSLNPSP